MRIRAGHQQVDPIDWAEPVETRNRLGLRIKNHGPAPLLHLKVTSDPPIFPAPAWESPAATVRLPRLEAEDSIEIPLDTSAIMQLCGLAQILGEPYVVVTLTFRYWDRFANVHNDPRTYLHRLPADLFLTDQGSAEVG
ncbi:MAG: hypothetical protein M3Q10_17040 [Chloroflexota bacterium]|nr:hypothetical protein [Chloroflexota bacterium]